MLSMVGRYNIAMAVWTRNLVDVARLEAAIERQLPQVRIVDARSLCAPPNSSAASCPTTIAAWAIRAADRRAAVAVRLNVASTWLGQGVLSRTTTTRQSAFLVQRRLTEGPLRIEWVRDFRLR
ncbi:hypothetical protein [Streptomyces sp. NPDC005507]|uniref:hypothetical protein n=1 Tax=Streptomyces sp. NPDC005507 TaxID=3154885 RepID=UPI0033B5B1AF